MYFTVKVTGAELDVVRLALGRMVEAKPVVDRKAKADVAPPVFDTGDDRLDAFMRGHWRPADRAAADKRASAHKPSARSLAFPFDLKQLRTDKARDEVARFNAAAIQAWRDRGYKVVVAPLDGVRSGIVGLDGRNVHIAAPGWVSAQSVSE